MTLEDAETGKQIDINTSSQRLKSTFAQMEDRRWKELKRVLGSRGVDVVPLRTDRDYLPPLKAFFAQRERRRF